MQILVYPSAESCMRGHLDHSLWICCLQWNCSLRPHRHQSFHLRHRWICCCSLQISYLSAENWQDMQMGTIQYATAHLGSCHRVRCGSSPFRAGDRWYSSLSLASWCSSLCLISGACEQLQITWSCFWCYFSWSHHQRGSFHRICSWEVVSFHSCWVVINRLWVCCYHWD